MILQTEAAIPLRATTEVFLKEADAEKEARRLKTYVFSVFNDRVKNGKRKTVFHGYGVPK